MANEVTENRPNAVARAADVATPWWEWALVAWLIVLGIASLSEFSGEFLNVPLFSADALLPAYGIMFAVVVYGIARRVTVGRGDKGGSPDGG